jgi:hypothetical protein
MAGTPASNSKGCKFNFQTILIDIFIVFLTPSRNFLKQYLDIYHLHVMFVTQLGEATHITMKMFNSVKPREKIMTLCTVMPVPANAGLNPDDKG